MSNNLPALFIPIVFLFIVLAMRRRGDLPAPVRRPGAGRRIVVGLAVLAALAYPLLSPAVSLLAGGVERKLLTDLDRLLPTYFWAGFPFVLYLSLVVVFPVVARSGWVGLVSGLDGRPSARSVLGFGLTLVAFAARWGPRWPLPSG